MANYLYYLKMGKRMLRNHQPEQAVTFFRQAVEKLPPSDKAALHSTLYYLGISLKKVNSGGAALKSWLVARQNSKRGYASCLVTRFSNRYGMVRQGDSDKDDWKAFYSIHAAKYLLKRGRRKFGSPAEKDMIWDLIFDSFKGLKLGYSLSQMDTGQKLRLFHSVKIIFPLIVMPVFDEPDDSKVISWDFQQDTAINEDSLCSCHSGLPYSMCCGRTCCQDELDSGRF